MDSRIDVDGLKLIIMQRLHDADLIGYVLEQNTYEYLMLPALYEPERRCKTYTVDQELFFEDPRKKEGEALFPAKFPAWLIKKRMAKELDEGKSSAMYRQDPVPAGGNIIKTDHFRYYNPDYAQLIVSKAAIVIQSWDTAIKGMASSTWTVGQCWALLKRDIKVDETITLKQGMYLIDQVKGKWNFTANVAQIKEFTKKWPTSGAKLIEDKASGPDIVDHLTGQLTGLILSDGQEDKEERAHAISYLWEAGNVYVPGRPPTKESKKPDFSMVPWMGGQYGFYEEVTRYPKSKWTDQAITMSQALKYLASKSKAVGGMPTAVDKEGVVASMRKGSHSTYSSSFGRSSRDFDGFSSRDKLY
jgi:predicted phage terminase large subunit-like protein